ncbi:HAMP domain-containing histidine kinase [Halarchaeum sp. CBA1220]|nr:HAMP domain-containing histidine kinase [Halarchaeum sp. CBA1220]
MLCGFTYFLARGTLDAVALVTHVSSLPFAVLLAYGGYWLSHGDVSPARYRRVALWVAAAMGFFVALFAVIAFTTQSDWVVRVVILGWAASTGGGTGFLIGAFEARAVERAVAAERARVRNDELRRQNERLDDLASVISHDLRNPLTVARGYVDLLREDGDADDERLAAVSRSLDRMDRIVGETLALARSGRVIDDPEPVDLGEYARRCWSNVSTGNATLTVDSSAAVVADPGRLEHLFENLFRNAVEHGGSDVHVRVGTLDGGGFYVADDGPGIPAAERDVVFDPGYTTTEDGNGFGLAIVEQIVDAHGWEIRLAEADGGGARFEITGVETRPALGAAVADTDATLAGAG